MHELMFKKGGERMHINKKRWMEVGIVCLLFLFLAGYVETSEHRLNDKNEIIRGEEGNRDELVELTVDAGELLEAYDYDITVPAIGITKEKAGKYFEQAKREIDDSFFSGEETAECVTTNIHMKETYADGLVKAEWNLDRYDVVDIEGEILSDEIPEDGTLVQASAELSCGDEKEEYVFSFMVYPRVLTEAEQLLADIQKAVEREGAHKGKNVFTLPKAVDGVQLEWKEKKEHLVYKVLFFEIVILILLRFVMIERTKTAEKERRDQMSLDYCEVVSKLLILLGSGMSLKQSWNRISAQYLEKREKKTISERYIYEEMLTTNYEIGDGESERIAYEKFGVRTNLGSYQRLVRILIQNLQTGSRGLCELLEQESVDAMEERKAFVRKLGEEAGTKMLLPLVLMLGIVIVIIMVPAMMSFKL